MKRWTELTILVLALPLSLSAQDGEINWVAGPATVELGERATVRLEDGYLFADARDTRKIMEMTGRDPNQLEMGLVAPVDERQNWLIVFEYFPVGHVADEDRNGMDADALLSAISESTEASNVRRPQPLHVVGWSGVPRYDEASKRLAWAVEAEDDTGERSVQYNVRLLGRHGYTSVSLIMEASSLKSHKPQVDRVLSTFDYKPGQRYQDFQEGDQEAGYGLSALVAGGPGKAASVEPGLWTKLGDALTRRSRWVWAIGLLLLVGTAVVVLTR